jgi:hypothetical protein
MLPLVAQYVMILGTGARVHVSIPIAGATCLVVASAWFAVLLAVGLGSLKRRDSD